VLADAFRKAAPSWFLDCYASYETVGVFFREGSLSERTLTEFVDGLAIDEAAEPRVHTIPVCYEMGEDLSDVAARLNLSVVEVARLHGSQCYTCFAIGFCPGFPYLGYLPDMLRGIPRFSQPRLQVPAGSVAITGKQTAVYPIETPGGWAIIGRTPLEIVNVRDEYFPISAGDEVQFRRIDRDEFETLRGQRL